MEKGVEILLAARTRIPLWISNQNLNVKVVSKTVKERRVRSLQIKGGEASFGPAGVVDVKMPGSTKFLVAFQPLKVLEIHDLEGDLINRNHCLCENCFTNTGKILKESPSERYGRMDVVMQCSECCNTWALKGV